MTLSVTRRRQVALAAAVVVAAVGLYWKVFDTPGMALVVFAAGLLWSSRKLKIWLLAGAMVVASALWSRFDGPGCSAWWRGAIPVAKLSGNLPYVAWSDVLRATVGPCSQVRRPSAETLQRVECFEERTVGERKWERCRTDLGDFWIAAPGRWLLGLLTWEMTVQGDYDHPATTIRPDDTVIDCGAHVGVFVRYALRKGAGQVIAVEPEPTNIACLEANFQEEIADGRVVVVKAGVWDQKGTLELSMSPDEHNTGMHSFVEPAQPHKVYMAPVFPLDHIVHDLGLERVDFIKMDIEGAERQALRGAQQTLRRFKPHMAICTYHLDDDPTVIPSIVRGIEPSYSIHAKDAEFVRRTMVVKVMFFQ